VSPGKKAAVAKHGKRVALEVLGWTLVIAGIAALILPGPGLLAIFAGLVILSQQYEWAERRVAPVKKKALGSASDSVQTWPRIVIANLCALAIVGFGVFWLLQPPAPSWWPLDDKWWLFGGWPPGITLVLSGLFAVAMIVYSYRRFRASPYEED
jgi:Putative transmembrane protein (PGPGW)